MEILDDQEAEPNGEEQLSSPIFIKRIRFFSIITLVHSIALFILSILFVVFYFLINDFNTEETILLIYSGLFAFLGAFLLFRTYYFINQYIQKNAGLINLNKGLNHFFFFWIVLIFGFSFMIVYVLLAGF